MRDHNISVYCTISAALLALSVAPVTAQDVERVHLSNPDQFPEPFSSIRGLRELSDGRLLISDGLEQAVRWVDFEHQRAQQVGRSGQGPGEYRMPGTLLPLPGDSTLLVDFGNIRMTVIDPDGRFGASTPMLLANDLFIRPTGADATGRLFFEITNVMIRGPGGRIELPDSLAVGRVDRATQRVDTVAFVSRPRAGGPRTLRSEGGSFSLSGMGLLSAFPAQDSWAATPGGGSAVVRVADYHVEWIDSSGNVTHGPAVKYTPVRITRDDKDAWADQRGNASAIMMAVDGGGGSGSNTISLPRPDIDEVNWPEAKPPFPENAAWMTPEGELWVEQNVRFGEPATYDVFDAAGRLVRQVRLPNGRRLVGLGRGVVYLVNTDADDLQWLERYSR